jgi:6-phosphogluconate dehydrogenase
MQPGMIRLGHIGSNEAREYPGCVCHPEKGCWRTHAAIDEGIPVPVIARAPFSRFQSRGNADYAGRVLSGMRKRFGGHDEKKGEA